MEGTTFFNTTLAGVILVLLLSIILVYVAVVRPLSHHFLRVRLRLLQDEFFGLVSHYLLTPISIIQTAVIQLQEKDASMTAAERQRHYQYIQVGEQRLQISVEQIVLAGAISQGAVQLNFSVGDLSEVVSSAISTVDIFARNKNMRIHFNDASAGRSQARFDFRRLQQSIIAVLDNAIKFSVEDSAVEVALDVTSEKITITVEDEGVGIHSGMRGKLGAPFQRGTSQYTYDYEGIGLGLYMAQEILKLHGGSLQLNGHSPRGTQVVLQFPPS